MHAQVPWRTIWLALPVTASPPTIIQISFKIHLPILRLVPLQCMITISPQANLQLPIHRHYQTTYSTTLTTILQRLIMRLKIGKMSQICCGKVIMLIYLTICLISLGIPKAYSGATPGTRRWLFDENWPRSKLSQTKVLFRFAFRKPDMSMPTSSSWLRCIQNFILCTVSRM